MQDKTRPLYQITPHPIGSLREVWAASWPLMLGILSWSCMYFSDRIILAHYSSQAMNGAAFGGLACWAMNCFPVAILETTEVFVGRANGEGLLNKVGNAVWQMIWFVLMITPAFWLISYLLSTLIFHGSPNAALEYEYYITSIIFSPFFFFYLTLSGFSIGIGKMKIITWSMVTANCLNIALDLILVFGWGPIPSLGCKGAAIATGISSIFQALILTFFFFNKNNRQNYNTTDSKFNLAQLKESLSIAIPSAVGRTTEIIAHLVFFRIMIFAGEATMTLVTVIQSFFILLSFMIEGLMKGSMAIFSNLIGAGQFANISKVLRSALRLHALLFVLVATLLYSGCEAIITNFFSKNELHLISQPEFLSIFKKATMWMAIFFLFDGFSWILVGLLTSNKDTKFVMFASAALNWIAFVLPVYFFIGKMKHTADFAWMILAIYNFINFLVYLSRYYFKTRRDYLDYQDLSPATE